VQQTGLVQTRQRGAVALALLIATLVAGCTAAPPAAEDIPAPPAVPTAADIDGLIDFGSIMGIHVETPVDYEGTYGMLPPAGGDHWAGWLNCGVYSEPQENERAVHSLEHGAVWVTYDPAVVDAAAVDQLRASLPDTYIVLSPFPGLPTPVVASAWGYQVQLDGVDDPRLIPFVQVFWQSPDGPEPGAPCTGAIDGPGRVA
jgi:hypothetical protein